MRTEYKKYLKNLGFTESVKLPSIFTSELEWLKFLANLQIRDKFPSTKLTKSQIDEILNLEEPVEEVNITPKTEVTQSMVLEEFDSMFEIPVTEGNQITT